MVPLTEAGEDSLSMTGFIEKILAIGLVLGLPTGVQAQGVAQQAVGTTGGAIFDADDCTKIEIEIDEPGGPLTAAEWAALMDKAFYESLSRFDRCQAARSSSGGAKSGKSAAGPGLGDSGGAGSGAGKGAVESVASESMQGTSTEEQTEAAAVQSVPSQSVKGTLPKDTDKADLKTQPEREWEKKPTSRDSEKAPMSSTGKLPEDIPPVDNDSVLETQIRIAAMAEKDPVIKAKLWNEYRKYKGLPLVKAGEQSKP